MKTNFVLRMLSLACVSLLALNSLILTFKYEKIFSQIISGTDVSTHQSFLVVLTMGLLIGRLLTQKGNFTTMQFAMILFALICLIDEWVMYRQGTLPLTRLISSWAHQPLPNNWLELKGQWKLMLYWRCSLIVGCFLLVFGCDAVKKKSRSYPSVAAAA